MPAPVTVFGPHPLLAVTIERRGESDDLHLHPAGQGVWVARMAGELGADPVLCGFIGGETGKVLEPLLDELPGSRRLVRTAALERLLRDGPPLAASGARSHSRGAPRRPGTRSTTSFSLTVTSALASEVLVLCGPVPSESLPVEVYGKLVADAAPGDTRTIVDLSPPRLNSALEGEPDIVKVNDWQLGEFVEGPVSTEERDALRRRGGPRGRRGVRDGHPRRRPGADRHRASRPGS